MRLVRTTAVLGLMAGLFVASSPPASSANPVGNGFCDTPYPASGDFCIGKNDSGSPWADWSGDNTIAVFDDWRYSGFPTDSPNDDGESWLNGDSDSQQVYQDPNFMGPNSCFASFSLVAIDSDMHGREDNDSSLFPRFGLPSC